MAGVKITLDSARRVSELLSRDRNQPPRNRKRNTRPVDEGPVVFGFRLLDDASGGANAKIFTIDMVDELIAHAILRYKWGIIDGAKAGYEGDCVLYQEEYWFIQGPCIVKCTSNGSISALLAAAQIGVPYSGTVTLTNIDAGSCSMTGLPANLSGDSSGQISGAPTESGTFDVIVSGTSPKTGPLPVTPGAKCTVTKLITLTVLA